MQPASGTLLFQGSVSTPGTAVAAFTATVQTEVTRITVANTGATARTFDVHHDVGGSTFTTANALYNGIAIPANTTMTLEAATIGSGFMFAATDSLGFDASGTDVTFSIYGIPQDVVQTDLGYASLG